MPRNVSGSFCGDEVGFREEWEPRRKWGVVLCCEGGPADICRLGLCAMDSDITAKLSNETTSRQPHDVRHCEWS
jgi:hypothetical protein